MSDTNDRIKISALRQTALHQRGSEDDMFLARHALALLDLAEAARELAEAADSVAVYPEGAVGFDELSETQRKTEAALARFDFGDTQ